MAKRYTLAAPLRHEGDKIRGSRFIASLAPVADADEAMAFVQARRAEFPDATHNCFAWRAGECMVLDHSPDDRPACSLRLSRA